MLEIIKKEACKHGDRLAVLSAERLMEVKSDFDKLNIDTSPYYSFEPRVDLDFPVRSVLVVASPSPPAFASFDTKDGELRAVIPPSYIDDEKNYLATLLNENGFHIASANGLPCKPIAAHAGLGMYGRNNIIYVEGMGSFLRLNLYFSDIPCEDAEFYPFQWMECCENCNVCIKSCPTSALSDKNNVVDADRCLTWLNENNGEFPDWVNPAWHNALVGCVKCQYACPQNKPFLQTGKEVTHFSQEQTEALIDGRLSDELLKPLGLGYYRNVLSRNLKVLLNQLGG